jgi:hypothetical protein
MEDLYPYLFFLELEENFKASRYSKGLHSV